MASKAMKTIHVYAFEYVNPGPDAGGGGFNWFYEAKDADAAYAKALENSNSREAHFRFDVEVEETLTRDAITDEIDNNLDDLCAEATTRHVGADVLTYWNTNGMRMGQ